MDSSKEQVVKAVLTAAVLGTFTAAVRALIVKGESPMQRIRTFFAGVLISGFLGALLDATTLSNFWKILLVGAGGAFISTVWPVLEKFAKNYAIKKTDAIQNADKP